MSLLTLSNPETVERGLQAWFDKWFDNALSYVPYPPLCNFAGVPAISLPLGQLLDGMPLAMPFVATMGEDARLLRLAAALDAPTPGTTAVRPSPWRRRESAPVVLTSKPRSATLHPLLSAAERKRLFWHGVELFNAGRYFDAHEPWEEIWRSQSPQPRDLFQGLVQVAAGLHIWHSRGQAAPAARVLARGMRRLEAFRPAAMGIDVAGLLAALEPWRRALAEHGEPQRSCPRIRRVPQV